MGACLSFDEEEKKARLKSEAIDRMLEAEGREEENVVKILLLGKHDYQAIGQILGRLTLRAQRAIARGPAPRGAPRFLVELIIFY